MQAVGYQVEFLFSAHAFPANDDEQFMMFLQERLIKTLNTHNYCTYEAENLLDQLLYFTHKHQHTNPINDAAMLINMAKKNFSLLPTVFKHLR
jgi:hypothetical protein